MKRLSAHRSELPEASSESAAFWEDLRESFTDSFAYDIFVSWTGRSDTSTVTFRSWTATRPGALPKGGADDATDGDSDGITAFTNADIPVYTLGEVIPFEGSADLIPESNLSGPLVAVDDFRADARFAGIDGSGFAVAILDTGIDLDDPFFGPDSNNDGVSDRIVYHYDFADNDSNASDVNGHGSNVTSIAASSDGTYTGMAPGADIVSLKVFTNAGSGHFGYIEDALQWIIANAAAYNIVSVNMSLSDSGNYATPVQLYGIADELATLAAMDVIVVSASGNAFYNFNSVQGVAYPSADPNSLSVGAVYDGNTGGWSYSSGATAYSSASDRITPFSQRDDQLSDIFAPGAPITGAGPNSGLVTMHGTSQAAPHITGIIALAQELAVQELGRKLTFDEIEQLLASTGDTIIDGDDEDDNVNNTGQAFQRVNVLALGEAILAMAPTGPETFYNIAQLDSVKPEGDSGTTAFTFLVTRSGDTTAAGSVDYSVSGVTANPANAADFSGGFPSGTVSFAAGETSKVLTVEVSGDTEVEADEVFSVTLSNPSNGGDIYAYNSDGRIENDDTTPPGGTVLLIDADFNGSASGTEGFSYVDGAFDSALGISTNGTYANGNWTAADLSLWLGGVNETDVQNLSGGWLRSFTLDQPMEVNLSFLYRVIHAAGFEADEFVQVLYSLDGGTPQVVAQIAGNGNGGGNDTQGPATFEASLGLLAAGQHTLILGGYLNQKTTADEISYIYFDDVVVEGTLPVPATTQVSIAPLDAVVAEGDAGSTAFTFTVTRSGDTSEAGSVDYAVTGGQADAADFAGGVLPSGSLAFLAGEVSRTFTINVAGDSDFEGDEGFTVTLSNPSSGSEIVGASAQGSIVNDDPLPPEPLVLIDADFNTSNDTEGFTYSDGSFGGANPQTYASGGWQGGALTIDLGGIDSSIATNMSGGWSTSFLLPVESEVSLSFLYELVIAAGYEPNEFSQVLVSLDGGPSILVASLTGDGNGGSNQTTGVQSFSVNLGVLAAGSHQITIGGFNNQKTIGDETTEITLDDVLVTAQPTSAPPEGTYLAIAAENAVQAEGDAGTTAFTFTVTRSGDTSGASSVDYAVSGAAVNGADFGGSLPSGTVNFFAGETEQTVTLQVSGDTTFEADEAFTVTLSNASGDAEITTVSANGTILNDDAAPPATFLAIAAEDAVKAEGDAGTTAFTFTVTRSGDTSGAGSVDYAVSGAAVDGADFGGSLPNGTVNFLAGETEQTVTINVSGDTTFEGDEAFTVTLSNASAGSAITTPSAGGTILNDDPAPPSTFLDIAAEDAVKAEGDAGTTAFTFTVTRSGDTSGPGSVDYAVSGAAVNGADFGGSLPSGTVNFLSGEIEKTVTLQVSGDTTFEADEAFNATLSNASAGSAITTPSASGTILNDDPAPPSTFLAIAAEDAVKAEGDAGTTAFTFTVTRTGDTSGAGSVDYAVSNIEVNGNDFLGGVLPSGSLLFSGGEVSKTITINVAGDLLFEDDEPLTVTLFDASAGSMITTASASGTILNDDTPSPATFFSIAAQDAELDEGDSGTTLYTFFVQRSGDTSAAGSVDYAVSGAAVNAADFAGGVLPSGTVNFVANEIGKIFTIAVAGDAVFENDESFTVTLSNPQPNSAVLVSSAEGTILNDDPAPPATFLAIAAEDAVKAEGDAGTTAFTFTVTRGGDTTGAGSVDYAVSGAAVDGADFGGSLPGGTVNFLAGATEQTVTVQVSGDTTFEGDEDFTVTLSNTSAGTAITTASAGGTILNDDAAPPSTFLAIAAEDAVKAEGDAGTTAFTFTVTRTGDISGAGSVDYAVSGAAVDAADFGGALTSGTVNFLAGETQKTVTLQVSGDTAVEGDEAFTVTLSNASTGSAITTPSANGSILNDDTTPPSGPVVLIDEDFAGGSGAFTYADGTFGGANPQAFASGSWTAGALTLSLGGVNSTTATNMSGGWSAGFTLAEASEVTLSFLYELVIASGYEADEFSQVLVSLDGGAPVLVASLTGDGNGGSDGTTGTQSFNASLGVLAAGSHSITLGGFNNQKTIADEVTNITFDDVVLTATAVDSEIAIAADSAVLSEGDAGSTGFSFTVTRSGDLSEAASVDYSVLGSGGTPADGADFAGGLLPGGTVAFLAGEASKTLTLQVAGDSDFEGDEGFEVILANASPGNWISQGTAAGTILNDDPLPDGPLVLLEADFEGSGDTGGFSYADGVFGGAASQPFAAGSWSGGALLVDLGGGNGTVLDHSGAWETGFVLASEMNVTLSLDYELIVSEGYENDEYGRLLVSIDGGAPILVDELFGNNAAEIDLTTGPQSVVVDLGLLGPGSHEIAIGAYNNKTTWNDETTQLAIDSVTLSGTISPASETELQNLAGV